MEAVHILNDKYPMISRRNSLIVKKLPLRKNPNLKYLRPHSSESTEAEEEVKAEARPQKLQMLPTVKRLHSSQEGSQKETIGDELASFWSAKRPPL